MSCLFIFIYWNVFILYYILYTLCKHQLKFVLNKLEIRLRFIICTCDAINFPLLTRGSREYIHSRVGQHAAYRLEMQHVVVAQYNADHFRVEQRDSTPQFPFQS